MNIKSFVSLIVSAAFALSFTACQTGGKCPLHHKEMHKCTAQDCSKKCTKKCCPDKPCDTKCKGE